MGKKGNIICIILIVLILAGFCGYKHYEKLQNAENETKLETLRTQYIQEMKIEQEEMAAKEAHYKTILEDIPGIVCWGDDLTYGKGGINKSYPYVLDNLLLDNEYNIPVYNNGVTGEDTLTVLGRQGAIPYCVEAFKLKNSPELLEVKVTSSYNGAEVNPLLRKRNPGVNPCSIDGINGVLYGYVKPADLDRVNTFYFVRDNTGNAINVKDKTTILTAGMSYKDYINILAIGEHGGYADNEELLDQNKKFVEYLEGSKNQDHYLILGMTKGNKADNEEIEKMMSEEFGEHYINLREYLSTKALTDLNLPVSDADKQAMSEGRVPPSLWYDENNLNDTAYEAIGRLVYNKLVELNYIRK